MRSSAAAPLFVLAFALLASCAHAPSTSRPATPRAGQTLGGAPTRAAAADAPLALPEDGPPLAPEVSVQTGHTMPVVTLAASADGALLVSESSDSLRIWDVRSALLVRAAGRASLLGTLAVHPRGVAIAGTTSLGRELHLRDTATLAEKGKVALPPEAVGFAGVAFTADGAHVIAGVESSANGVPTSLRVLSATDLAEERTVALEGETLSALAVDPKGAWAAAGIAGGRVVVVDLATGRTRCALDATRPGEMMMGLGVLSLAADASGERLAATYNDGVLATIDVARCVQTAAKRGATHDVGSAGSFAPSYAYTVLGFVGGDALVLGKPTDSGDGEDALFRWTPGGDPKPIALDAEHPRAAALVAGAGGLLAVAPGAGGVRLYEAATAHPLRRFEGRADQVVPLGFDAAERTMYLLRGGAGALDALDLGTARATRTCRPADPIDASSVAVDPARGVFAALTRPKGSYDKGVLALYALDTCARKTELARDDAYEALAFAEDGSLVATGYRSGEGYFADVRDPGATRARLHVKLPHSGDAYRALVSARTHRLVIGQQPFESGAPVVVDTMTGAVLPFPEKRLRGGAVVALSADGTTIATAARGGPAEITLWDARTLAKKRTLTGADVPFGALAFAPDGAALRAVDVNGAGRVFDLATGASRAAGAPQDDEPVLAAFSPGGRWFVSFGLAASPHLEPTSAGADGAVTLASTDGEYVVFAPTGEYLAPRASLPSVAFRLGARAYPFEQFDLLLDRPHAILQRLGASADVVARLARLEGIRADRYPTGGVRVGAMPVVRLGPVPLASDERVVRLRVQAASRAPLARVQAWVDDVPAASAAAAPDAHTLDVELPITLGAGTNHVDVSAFDAAGIESLRESAIVTYAGDADAKPSLWVLSVGVSKYADARFDLTYAAKDARDVASFFGAPAAARYAGVHVRTLLDRDATREGVLAAVRSLAGARVDDVVVVFFAGHGMIDADAKYFFGTTDIDPKDPRAHGLAYEALEQALGEIPARRKLVLVDTCHAGVVEDAPASLPPNVRAATRGFVLDPGRATSGSAPPPAPPRLVDDVVLLGQTFGDMCRSTGAAVVASSEGSEYAFESDAWKNGVFTYALLDGLRTRRADADGDGVVRVSELRAYVGTRVSELTSGAQHPTARRENLVLDFPVQP